MPQTPERRMYLYWRSLKRSRRYRSYRHDHYQKGWIHSPLMEVARTFRRPVREVRDIIDAQKGPRQ